jgi:DHA1 family inner membrane transport protein
MTTAAHELTVPIGVVGSGAMLANVVGVPVGALAGQLAGWRGPFWALAALAVASIGLISRYVPHDGPDHQLVSMRSELSALRSRRLWLALAACATTTGGVGGRLGDVRPHATTIVAPAVTTFLLLAICLLSAFAAPTVALVALLGLFGLGANPVLISLAVRFAGRAPTLASALTVSSFNFGTAVGCWIAGLALASTLGATGPAVVGAAIAARTLIPTTALAVAHR